MALKKKIELDNGIIVNYHRIVSINKITNGETIIEVGSYTSEEKRQDEINYYNPEENNELGAKEPMNVFIDTTYINTEYNENATIEDMYDYLKTLDKFKDATNI